MKKLLKSKFILNVFYENFLLGINSILSNKTRALLSILGIVIGIASVIIVTSLGTAATSDIKAKIESIGTSTIIVTGRARGNANKILLKEIFTTKLPDLIKDNISNIKNIVVDISVNAICKYNDNWDEFKLRATDDSWLVVNNYDLLEGRFLTENDKNILNVVLGYEVAETLFPDESPIDKQIKIYYKKSVYSCNIIGVMEEKTKSIISDFNTDIYIHSETFKNKIFRSKSINNFFILVDKPENAPFVTDTVDLILKRLAAMSLEETELYYQILSQQEMLETYENVSKTLALFLGGIAAISLIVGGIGIMNIMLVSVTERTREIGVRKALGAKNSYIFSQFLIEASLISVIGGIIGVFFGFIFTFFIVKAFNWSFTINVPAVFISILFSIFIGEFFGFYPARKAARLNPLDALRYE